ncbi:cystinosin [Culex quinquefasciatus]|uniref:Cystinosin homolog n=1 Tax=Culex quinquefasciatus TaxID=7176 RepID=B0W5W3_CULQU|nr:cystinosin [Culex quinquefasciatus]|eukprot:XP_001844097.1 cystinosin [Culex quinquefasciatus]
MFSLLGIFGYSYTKNFSVQFSDSENAFVQIEPPICRFYKDEFHNNLTTFQAIGRRPGRFIVKALVELERFVDDQRLFVRLKVALSQPLIIISLIIGWTYTACWSSGYYPQIYLNYKRQNVVGLSFDFLHINIIGHVSYAIFNSFMYWNSAIEQEYFKRHPYGLNPVIGNDVGFAVHACFATGFTILQCYVYENGGNSISKTAKAIIILYFHIIIGAACSVWFWSYHWLDFLYVLSYIKLSTTLVKYFPQAYMNYKRQSTEGFAIMNRLLDIAGGLFGILQMVINAWNFVKSSLGNQIRTPQGFTRSLHLKPPALAGHSKWQNIRHIKALNDGRKSTLFIKLARQMRLAMQAGGPNPAVNATLRAAIDEALKKNMPNSTIQGILKKFATQQSAAQLKKFTVEIKAFDQVNLICVLYTDRFTQLKMEMATTLRKNFSNFSEVKHMFDEQGYVEAIASENKAESDLLSACTEDAIEAGAEDVELMNEESRLIRFLCDPNEIDRVRTQLEKLGYVVEHSEHAFFPKSTIKLNPDATEAYEKLKEKLQAMDGVEDLYDNVEVVYQ